MTKRKKMSLFVLYLILIMLVLLCISTPTGSHLKVDKGSTIRMGEGEGISGFGVRYFLVISSENEIEASHLDNLKLQGLSSEVLPPTSNPYPFVLERVHWFASEDDNRFRYALGVDGEPPLAFKELIKYKIISVPMAMDVEQWTAESRSPILRFMFPAHR